MPLHHSPTRIEERSKQDLVTEMDKDLIVEELPSTSQVNYPSQINATSMVKLPPFWKENPILWFTQIEAAFAISRISSDDTKYRYTIVNLDKTVLPFVSDILSNPPIKDKYETLKTRIISSFDESSESKLRRLIRGNEMIDEKPSNFLQRLRNLEGGLCSESVLKTLFLEQLPENVEV